MQEECCEFMFEVELSGDPLVGAQLVLLLLILPFLNLLLVSNENFQLGTAAFRKVIILNQGAPAANGPFDSIENWL